MEHGTASLYGAFILETLLHSSDDGVCGAELIWLCANSKTADCTQVLTRGLCTPLLYDVVCDAMLYASGQERVRLMHLTAQVLQGVVARVDAASNGTSVATASGLAG